MNWLNQQPFYIKLTNKEYWPSWVMYFPVYIYYALLVLKTRSFFFFTATNPGIETGGLFGESKKKTLDKIADKYKPLSLFFSKDTPFDEILTTLKNHHVEFPIVIKPDVGARGTLVEKVDSIEALKTHIDKNNVPYIIQPFIDYKEELGIMYWRMPNEDRLKICSVTRKKFLSFTGDGKRTLREMIMASSRAILQYDKLATRFADKMDIVLSKGELLEVEPIGNHCRGTMFLNANNLIDSNLEAVIADIALGMDEVYFGRFDLKCKSIEDLKKGKNIAVLELNGVCAEPTHIYDPNSTVSEFFTTIVKQWTIISKIAMYNHKVRGIPFETYENMMIYWDDFKKYNQSLKV